MSHRPDQIDSLPLTPPPQKKNAEAFAWKRDPIFRFLSSLSLALLLLGVLILASVIGTLYESSLDAKTARAYIYNAPWFNFWLVLLAVNLGSVALSRMPWKKHHTGFLITHLGIILLLSGALIDRIWGIEGTMTLHKGEAPFNTLLVDEKQLIFQEPGKELGLLFPLEFAHTFPTPDKPRHLFTFEDGMRLDVIQYSENLESRLLPRPASPIPGAPPGSPAVAFHLNTKMMNQQFDRWLFATENPEHNQFDLGLATITLQRGLPPVDPAEKAPVKSVPAAPAAKPKNSEKKPAEKKSAAKAKSTASAKTPDTTKPTEAVDISESIFAFEKLPGQQIGRASQGGTSGAKITLTLAAGNKPTVRVDLSGHTLELPATPGNKQPLPGTPFSVEVVDYWPDFRLSDGKPGTASDQPLNPTVLVTLRGHAVPDSLDPEHSVTLAPASTTPQHDDHAHSPAESAPDTATPPPTAPGMAPSLEDVMRPDASGQKPNRMTLYFGDDGAVRYELFSRKAGRSTGLLSTNSALPLGWADWTLILDSTRTNVTADMQFFPSDKKPAAPAAPMMAAAATQSGVKLRLTGKDNATLEEWIPLGWRVPMQLGERGWLATYSFRTEQLPIGLQLLDFEVQRNEGTMDPASFKSTLKITGEDGSSGDGQCWMNNPTNFPRGWWRTLTGFTYKISQASWNPQDLGESTVQILRDPGWAPKWIGCILICCGIFSLFYLRPPRGMTPPPRRSA